MAASNVADPPQIRCGSLCVHSVSEQLDRGQRYALCVQPAPPPPSAPPGALFRLPLRAHDTQATACLASIQFSGTNTACQFYDTLVASSACYAPPRTSSSNTIQHTYHQTQIKHASSNTIQKMRYMFLYNKSCNVYSCTQGGTARQH